MSAIAANLAGVMLFALPGFFLTAFFPALRSLPPARRAAYGYLLGVVAVAGDLYVLSCLFAVPIRRPAIFGTAAVWVVAGLLQTLRVRSRPAGESRHRLTLAVGAVGLAGLAVSLGLFAFSVSQPLQDWDGRMHWSAQARYIRYEGTVLPTAVTRGQWYVNHPRYPVLLPVAQAAVLEAVNAGEDELPFRGVYAAFFPVLLLVVWDAARRQAGWLPAAVTAAALAGLPFLVYGIEGGAVSTYSDVPLACFYGAAVVLLLRSGATAADGVAAGLLLGGAVLTKNEGTILAGFALAAAALPRLRAWRQYRRYLPRLGAAAAVALAALVFFLVWRSHIPNRQDEMYGELVQALPHGAATRLPEVAGVVLERTFLGWSEWQGFWWAAVLILLTGWRIFKGRRAALARPLALAALGPLCIGWAAYAVHWEPVGLARVTWDRLLLQGLIPFAILLALAVRETLRARNRVD